MQYFNLKATFVRAMVMYNYCWVQNCINKKMTRFCWLFIRTGWMNGSTCFRCARFGKTFSLYVLYLSAKCEQYIVHFGVISNSAWCIAIAVYKHELSIFAEQLQKRSLPASRISLQDIILWTRTFYRIAEGGLNIRMISLYHHGLS